MRKFILWSRFYLIQIFSEEHLARSGSLAYSTESFPKDIHGAPPGSFVVRLSEIFGSLKSLQKMALFWISVVAELRRLWSEGQPIPHVPLDEKPDLNSCLLHQQLQVINCCIARKKRQATAIESLDSLISHGTSYNSESVDCHQKKLSSPMIYARSKTGDLVLRLGADHPSENLTMLETGEPIYLPVTQEGPVLTEDLIRETEEFVLRTGSLGAGCSQLLSDMQAFKAANPGCILEDFIRWHSPPDWTELEPDEVDKSSYELDTSLKRGCLSRRMQKEGNLWRELWKTSKPLPAAKQTSLFDEDLAAESIFTTLDDIIPSELFEQLFVSAVFSGLVIAEAALSKKSNLSKLFYDHKEYVSAACECGISNDNINDICKVYEKVEMILLHPEEATEVVKQSEETSSGEQKRLFRKFTLNFAGKDKVSDKTTSDDQKKSDERSVNVFSNLFDGKTSLFSKKPPKPDMSSSAQQSCIDEKDWAII